MFLFNMSFMLYYLAHGPRRYDLKPVYVNRRKYWEFQAVLSGELAAIFYDRAAELGKHRLWLMGPDVAHGWDCPQKKEAEIVVFQFATVPDLLQAEAKKNNGVLSCDLNSSDCHRLRTLWQQAHEIQQLPQSDYSDLLIQQIKGELTLLVLRAQLGQRVVGKNNVGNAGSNASSIVEKALAWYEEQLHERPSYEMMAAAVYVSPAHLRRLFHQQMQCSPQKACEALRFQRACDMLQQGHAQHQQIAEACGYSDASSFSRSFKRYTGKSPSAWKH